MICVADLTLSWASARAGELMGLPTPRFTQLTSRSAHNPSLKK